MTVVSVSASLRLWCGNVRKPRKLTWVSCLRVTGHIWRANGQKRGARRVPAIGWLPGTTMAAALVLLLSGCHSSSLPKPATKAYLDEVTAFYVGLAALQVGDDVRADSTLERATQLAQGEPAGWANWGLLALRQGNFDIAAQRLGRAQKMVPGNDQVHFSNCWSRFSPNSRVIQRFYWSLGEWRPNGATDRRCVW
jgi:hypothetical protein